MAQSVKRPTSAQVMISRSVSSSPASGSVLTARSLEPASDSVSPSLWPSPVHVLSLPVSKINKTFKKKKKKDGAQRKIDRAHGNWGQELTSYETSRAEPERLSQVTWLRFTYRSQVLLKMENISRRESVWVLWVCDQPGSAYSPQTQQYLEPLMSGKGRAG